MLLSEGFQIGCLLMVGELVGRLRDPFRAARQELDRKLQVEPDYRVRQEWMRNYMVLWMCTLLYWLIIFGVIVMAVASYGIVWKF